MPLKYRTDNTYRPLYRVRCLQTYLWLVKYADTDELYDVCRSVHQANQAISIHRSKWKQQT